MSEASNLESSSDAAGQHHSRSKISEIYSKNSSIKQSVADVEKADLNQLLERERLKRKKAVRSKDALLSELEILKQCLRLSDYEKVKARKIAAARLIEINHYKQQVEDCVVEISEKENLIAEILESQSKIKQKTECTEYSRLLQQADETEKQLVFITGLFNESEERKDHLHSQLVKTVQKLFFANATVMQLKQENNNLKQELQGLKSDSSKISSQFDKMQLERQQLENNYMQLKHLNEKLKERTDGNSNTTSVLNKEVHQLKVELKNKNIQIGNLTNKITTVRDQLCGNSKEFEEKVERMLLDFSYMREEMMKDKLLM